MHTFWTVAAVIVAVLSAAGWLALTRRLGGQIDQARGQLHRERDPEESRERLASRDDLGPAA